MSNTEAVKDIFVLILIIYLIRKNVQIGHVIFSGAILFGLLHQVSVWRLSTYLYTTLASPSTLIIFGALILISLLENIMRHTGSQGRLVSGLKNLSGDPRFAMAALPAIIGLLPSPGGARFSAPMVEEAARGIDIKSEDNAIINYWYRHVWEFFLPLYPSTLLAAELLNIPFSTYALWMLPFTVVTSLVGLILFRKVLIPESEQLLKKTFFWRHVLEGLSPILAIMIMVLILKMNVLLSLLLTNIALLIIYRVRLKSLPPLLKNALGPRLLYLVYAAIYFRDVLVQSGAINQLQAYFKTVGLSPVLIALTLPLIIALLTGMTIPGISISMPFIVGMAGPGNLLALGALATAANMAGALLSPVHLCLIMSIEHFCADFTKSYRKLFLPVSGLLAFSLLYYYLL